MNEQAGWLALREEEAIEPQLPICDPHHHLWDHPGHRYLLDELLADTGSGHRIEQTVFVECASEYREEGPESLRPVGETEFVDRVARASLGRREETRVAAGIVGLADLSLGDGAAAVLEAHLEASPERFRGIRHACGWDASPDVRNSHTHPPPGLLLDAEFRRGFAALDRYGLSFDAWLYHPQIGELADLAGAFPATTIILDHVGGPLGIGPYAGRRDEVFADWKAAIETLAGRSNVVVKLGGLAMPICGFGWHKAERPPGSQELVEAWRPYLMTCIERFGVERCMFESNFPVDKRSCSYTVLWNAFKRLTSTFSVDERRALFQETAQRVYRLSG